MRTCIRGAKIFTQEGILEKRDLIFDQQIISIVPRGSGEGTVVLHEGYVCAGFIDLNIHGADGADAMEGTPEAFRTMAAALPRSGVTSFVATTMSDTKERIRSVLQASRAFRSEDSPGSELLGIHLEGPFLNPAFAGAHDPAMLRDASQEWSEAEQEEIRIITLAPERDRDHSFIRKWASEGIVISLGHSEASYEGAEAAWRAGASHVAHFFHTMPPLHHRSPGLLGAALALPFTIELISDGVHVHPALYDVVEKVKGYERVNLITCATAGLFRPDGIYPLGNQQIEVKGSVSALTSGKLAGSVHRLDRALRKMVEESHIPINHVLAMLTENPAKRLGLQDRKGSLDEGKDADIVLLDEELRVVATYVKGKEVYRKTQEGNDD